MPKENRISIAEFNTLPRYPKERITAQHISISTYPTTLGFKMACIISKKILKRAVDRNKLKRRIRSIFFKYHTTLDNIITIYPKKTALTISFSELEEEIKNLINRIK